MQIRDFIVSLEKMNFSLSVKEGKLILKGDSKKLSKEELEAIKTNQEVINYIKTNKEQLIEYISLFPGASVAKNAKDIVSVYRLSGLQQGMLFHGLYDNAGSYLDQVSCNFIGVNVDVLLASWAALIKRHSILRSAFYYDSFSIPVQCVYRAVELPVENLDYRDLDADAQSIALKAYETADRARGFDFKSAPLMRLTLIRVGTDNYRMLWTSHHILFDGWSVPILMEEFLNTYELLLAGNALPEEIEDRYEDYIRYLERRDKTVDEKYWRNYLQGITHGTLLPFVITSSERTKGIGRYESLSLAIDKNKTGHIQRYAQLHRLTVNTLMQGIWALLLHKFTGDPAVIYGVVVSGRPAELPGVEQRVGMYINTLALKAIIEPEQEIVSWLQALQADQGASRQYQYTALQDVQGLTGIKGDLFDTLLIFENYPVGKMVESGSWSLKVENLEVVEETNYPLTVIIGISDELNISFNYNTELLEQAYVSDIRDQFEQVLLQITDGQANTFDDIRILTLPQEEKLLRAFNNTSAPYPKEDSIVSLLEKQAARTPEATAVVFEQEELSYKQLNERSNQLAHYLVKNGVKAETLVPICVERGLDMIVGILGILKAGGAYVPIDPEYPSDRINYMLEDAGARIGLSSRDSMDKLQEKNLPVIAIDGDWDMIAKESVENSDIKISPSQLAYVIYTSGSTGKPKGVMIEHGGVVNLGTSQAKPLKLKPGMRSLQFASFGFDASVYEIFNTLLSGGTLVLSAKEDLLSAERFTELVKTYRVELAVIPPSFQLILDESIFGILKTIVSAGEALNEITGRFLQSRGVRLINAYGPTETTVCATLSEDPIRSDHIITIGKPISNAYVRILNDGELSPVGVTGEICVGGAGLARGYLNRSELTAEKFIEDTFGDDQNARLYRTGDLGRWLPDGNIEYQGRMDDQVKIRGYRIELGEIESVLSQNEHISQGVVLAKEDSSGNKRLIGYVVPSGEFDKKMIQEYLGTRLPEYMVPDLWIELDSMPLSSSGKIDRKALPDPEDLLGETNNYVAPFGDIEIKLAEIWQDVLEVDQISATDDFFELGGHSLLAIRVVSAVRKAFGMELPINDVFDYPTIDLLAKRLVKEPSGDILPPVKPVVERPEHIPLSFSQERLWFIDQLEGSLQYHLPAVLRLKGQLDKEALTHTLRTIIERHEVLRSVILKDKEGQGYQQIMPVDGWGLETTENTSDEATLSKYVATVIGKPFNLSADYMLRAELIKITDQDHVLVVIMHHIASDGWSTSILVKEVVTIYEAYITGKEAKLPPLPVQYADYAIWQRTYMQGDVLDKKIKYWTTKLEDVTPLQLPTDYSRPVIQSSKGAIHSFQIDKKQADQLKVLSQASGTTLYMTILAAFNVLLYRYSGQEDICVGTPVAGRNQQELEGLIGFFINTLALRNEVGGNLSFRALLEEVKTTTLEAYSHQEVPFEKVVDAVVKVRDMSRSPLFQVMFSLENTPEVPELKLGGLSLSGITSNNTTAKFDLTFVMGETSSGIQGTVEYNTDLYFSETIERMTGHYLNILQSVVAFPDKLLGQITMMTSTEERILLEQFNDTKVYYQTNKNIVTLVDEQASRTPGATAIIFGDQLLTYEDLVEKSNQLAHYLIKQGIKEETLVPVCMERSMAMIIAMLGIMKAGGAYVPVDPEYPADRISYMLKDTGATLVLSNTANRQKLNQSIPVIALDSDWPLIEKEERSEVHRVIHPAMLAYVIYTSGSTGKPKGVMIEHQSLVNLISWHNQVFEVEPASKATSMAGVGFDAFGWEIWPYLAAGASICVIDNETRLSATDLTELFITKQITHSFISTALIPDFIDRSRNKESSLKYLLTGGDKLSAINLDGIGYTLVNNYGPTENTVVATSCHVSQRDITPSIGKPIANSTVYILNSNNVLSPVGVPGEICIGGASLARGYLNQPELTAEKFIKDPFNNETDARLYKTGDLGRWLPDGNIEYLGRMDDQVKIRGYRIELGEIENVLNQSNLVDQSIVLIKEDIKGNKWLVGYVVSPKGFDKLAVQNYLRTKLPDYMIPVTWVELESIPLTPNGKIDRKALPDTKLANSTTEYVAPRNETEVKLAAIWQTLLGVERVGVYDNFFELGGHSLLAMRVVSYIERDLLVTIPIHMLFKFSSISDLSKYLEIQNNGNFEERNAGTFKLLDV